MTYEADELRRNWKKCSCPIYASGTLNGVFKRKNTERTAYRASAPSSLWASIPFLARMEKISKAGNVMLAPSAQF
jgi:hypothetical protein